MVSKMSEDYVFVRKQTAVQRGSALVFTGKYEIVQSRAGWGQLGEVIGVVDDAMTAFNMCKLINGSPDDRQEEVVAWNGYIKE